LAPAGPLEQSCGSLAAYPFPATWFDLTMPASPYAFDAHGALLQTELPFPCRRGKVRDVYDLGDRLAIVSSDRISAFDWILPSGIPEKGRLLTAMSVFWFDRLDVQHHLIDSELPTEWQSAGFDLEPLEGRTMVVRKSEVIPFECVVRGYLEGSGWREYQQTGAICGVALPAGLQQCDRLPEPIFTPATKAESGHDENVSLDVMRKTLGDALADQLCRQSLQIYQQAADYAAAHGILIADTKFEFGRWGEQVILIDEVLTPDSSRFWAADQYQPGGPQPSFDKQFVREWLAQTDWDRHSPPPALPPAVIANTQAKYAEAFARLCGPPDKTAS